MTGSNVDIYGYDGDGQALKPGATATDLIKNIAQDYEELGFEAGPSSQGTPQIEPARLAAEHMEKLIHDQLEEPLVHEYSTVTVGD